MTFMAALIVYWWIYFTVYFGGFVFIIFLLQRVVPHSVSSNALGQGLVGTIALALLLVASYRARLAAGEFVRGDVGFWRSHLIAGAVLRAHLSYVPLLGRFFGGKNQEMGLEKHDWHRGSGPPPPIE